MINHLKHSGVSIASSKKPQYPTIAPFHPSEQYPEYQFANCIAPEKNYTYAAVRESLYLLGLDKERFGTPSWNPFGHFIKPGMDVVLKPNWVLSRHFGGGDIFSVITHPAVVRAIMDYVWIALKGEGKITIAEAPQYNCNFDELREVCQIDSLHGFFQGLKGPTVEFFDLRRYWSPKRHFPSMKIWLPSDPAGKLLVNLGKKSAVYGKKGMNKVYGAVYHRKETAYHHTGERQEYFVSQTIMNGDVVINIPKLKVHKKVGVTLNMKNFVGASLNTNLNTHYILGSPSEGGDQFPDNHYTPMERGIIQIERWMYDTFLAKQSIPLEYIHRTVYWLHGTLLKPFGIKVEKKKRLLDAGAWYGNDCAWRFVVDLPRILTFVDKKGKIHDTPQRTIFSVIDGVIGGDNKGPLEPDAKPTGVILASENMVAADVVATRLMGFDYKKLKIFGILEDPHFNWHVPMPKQIKIRSNIQGLNTCFANTSNMYWAYKAHPGWKGHIEI